ncbi:response regulator transcription factor [Chryseobacterium sp. Y16C]|uniref:response regulator transcription factor n=1 Tax=Chryseobacterium sp. Y16C TaxID=2920939 RepID=UPI001F0B168C|nr:response regulator transcription factor [Chryseobacterium sp. Y16C]UMQ43145.1 response regulator transcription factor [Chryseobacterium sp. Y16C]
MKILIIEDQQELAENISSYLKGENYVCEFASDYQEAIFKTEEYNYDCILLDLMLPSGDGLSILENLRSRSKQDGVIIISAKDAIEDKIDGLKLGADDYLAKPFHLSELGARIYSVIRRKHFGSTNGIFVNEIYIDLLAKTVRVNSLLLTLTRKEFDLLLFLVGNKNKNISKVAIAEHLSGEMADMMDNHDFIYSHLKNLKKKLTEAGCKDYIKTTYGMGYKWES